MEAGQTAKTADEFNSTAPDAKERFISSLLLKVHSVLKHHVSPQSRRRNEVSSGSLPGAVRDPFTRNDEIQSFQRFHYPQSQIITLVRTIPEFVLVNVSRLTDWIPILES